MIKYECHDNEIRIWWDKREDKTEDMRYKVIIDGVAYVLTNNIYYDFPNLEQGKEYKFEIQLIDKNKNVVGRKESIKLSTLRKREVVDVTNSPYNAKNDGVTDNTQSLQKAFNDSESGRTLHFPLGVFISEELTFSGDIDLRFDMGSVLCDSLKEGEL